MIHTLIQHNFIVVITAAVFIVFVLYDRTTEKHKKLIFLLDAIVVFLLVAGNSAEYICRQTGNNSIIRDIAYAVTHTLRGPSIYAMIAVAWDASVKKKIILFIPSVLNGLVLFTSWFTHLAFWFDSNGNLNSGPLFFFSYVISFAYLLKTIYVSLNKFKSGHHLEGAVVIFTAVSAIIGIAIETFMEAPFIINGIIITSILFYYLYYRSQVYKCDALTGLLNRHSFYHDSQFFQKKKFTVVSVDLNNLKVINDTEGHEAGDKAIKTAADALRKYAPEDCMVYRMGGDEYALLCPKMAAIPVSEFMKKAYDDVHEKGYYIAWGLAEYSPGMNFEEVMAVSDSRMYEHKKKIKASVQK